MEKQNDPKFPVRRAEPAHRSMHRASMTGKTPQNGDKMMSNRRPPQELYQKKQKRKHTIRPVGCAVSLIFALIFTVFALYSALSISTLHRVNTVEKIGSVNGEQLTDCLNILLIGQKQTENQVEFMSLLTINSANKLCCIHMLHPDMYVSIPEHSIGTLTEAYQLGGAQLLGKTVSSSFDLKIADYIVMTSEGRRKLEQIFNLSVDHLDPNNIESVFEQLSKHGSAIEHVMKALNPPTIKNAFAIHTEVASEITTTLNTATLYGWSLYKPLTMRNYTYKTGVIPAANTYDIEQNKNGNDVLAVDLSRNEEIIKNSITE